MAQATAAKPAPAIGGALAIIDRNHAAIQAVCAPAVREMVEHCLRGSDLSFDQLIIDLMAVISANPKLAPLLHERGAFNLLITAGRSHTTFGDGGLWPIPDEDELRPQESEKFLTSRAERDLGCHIRAQIVFKSDEPVSVTRNALGEIVGISMNPKAPLTAARDESTLIGGFGIAKFPDGQARIEWFHLDDLRRRRGHSAAAKSGKSPMWKDDPLQGYERSIRAAMARLLVPVRFKSPGMVGGVLLPTGGADDSIDVDFERMPFGTDAQAAVKELENRGAPLPDHLDPERGEAPKQDAVGSGPAGHATGAAEQNAQQGTLPGAGDDTPQLDPPIIVGKLAEMIANHDVLKAAFAQFGGAFRNLPAKPQGLQEIYLQVKEQWGVLAEKDGCVTELKAIRTIFWAEAKKAGYEQQ